MKVVVDRDRCEGNAVCVRCCAEMFRLGDEDKVEILMATVPERLRTHVELAVNRCPRQALALTD